MINLQRTEQPLHNEVTLLLDLKVLSGLRDRSLKRLDRNFSQIWQRWVDIADRGVEYLADLIVGQLLVDVLLEELAEEPERLYRGKPVLQIGVGGVV